MRKPAHLPEPFDSRPFTVSAALAAGITPKRLRASDLSAPFRGVRGRAGSGDVLGRMSAYAPLMAAGQLFSHLTAAQAYGIPMPRRFEEAAELHVSVGVPAMSPRARGVIGHRLSGEVSLRSHRGLPVLGPEQTWCQLAAILGELDLIVAGDFLVRRKRPLSSLIALSAAVERLGSGRGSRAARRALVRIRPRTDSPMESRLRLLLVDGGLPEPIVGYPIRDADGFFVGTPDLAYPRERIAIEYEGDHHRTDPRVYADDIERRELMEAAAWLVIRVISSHLGHRSPWLLERVARALRERG